MTEPPKRGVVPAAYRGRETGFIKHELLRAYLKRLFLIVGMSGEKLGVSELCYVDCFAGPWGDESDELASTSIGISLAILEECHAELAARGRQLTIRALFIEKDKSSFSRLQTFLAQRTSAQVKAEALPGDFVALRDDILRWCGPRAFAFFFIDPKGWTPVQVSVLAPILARPRSEFLINFMYDFMNRAASMTEFQGQIAELLGEHIDVAGSQGLERERNILATYRRNICSRITANVKWPARSAYVRILDRIKDRTKYHLVYVTTHPHGIVVFMEISQKLHKTQQAVRAVTKQDARVEKSRQPELFGADTLPTDSDEVDPSVTQAFWLQALSSEPRRIDEAQFATFLEETDWFPDDLQTALGVLIKTRVVSNLDAKGTRRRRFLHFENGGERLVKQEQHK
jgi:three-Cys-motif partner protein